MCYSPGSKLSTFRDATSFWDTAPVIVENAYADGMGCFGRFHHMAERVFDVEFML